jgi:hypothetical protein
MKKVAALCMLLAFIASAQAYLNAKDVQVVAAMMRSMPGLVDSGSHPWDPAHPENACCFKYVACLPIQNKCLGVATEQHIDHIIISGEIGGSLPSNFGDLKNLTRLTLGHTHLVGPFPDSFSKLTSLKSIHIWGGQNDLRRFPNILPLTSLETIDLDGVSVQEGLPENWSQHSTLRSLTITSSGVQGTIPASWGNWKNLNMLWLSRNDLKGSIPSFAGSPKLEDLRLYHNQLSGTLPAMLSPALKVLEVQHNQLTGTIPSSYKFPQMELDENALVGTIPDIYEDVVVQRFSATHNKLTGPIPRSLLRNQVHMQVLDLSFNALDLCPPPQTIGLGSNTKCYLKSQANEPSCTCAKLYSPWCEYDCKNNFF